MDINIIGLQTITEGDGLAMSSSNKHLSPKERLSALSLKKGLDLTKVMVNNGEKDSAPIKNAARDWHWL